MGLVRTVSEINGDFCQKSQNFPTPHVFCASAEGIPLELDTGARGQKKKNDGATGTEKEVL